MSYKKDLEFVLNNNGNLVPGVVMNGRAVIQSKYRNILCPSFDTAYLRFVAIGRYVEVIRKYYDTDRLRIDTVTKQFCYNSRRKTVKATAVFNNLKDWLVTNGYKEVKGVLPHNPIDLVLVNVTNAFQHIVPREMIE